MRRPTIRKRRVLLLALATFLLLNAVAAVWSPPDNPLPPASGTAVESGRDPALGRAASALVGVKVEVWCWSIADWREKTVRLTRRYRALGHGGPSPFGPWSAFAWRHLNQVHLSPQVCAELRRLAEEPVPLAEAEWPDALAWAVAALAHEAYHVRGVVEEAEAECYGMQSITRTARLLGRSNEDGRSLTLRYLKRWRPGLPDSYRSPECRSDGLLDLDPDRAAWPWRPSTSQSPQTADANRRRTRRRADASARSHDLVWRESISRGERPLARDLHFVVALEWSPDGRSRRRTE